MALDSLWYYSRENEKRGPVTSSEMYRLANKQKILPEDLVWCDGMEKWVPARTIRGMFPEDDDAGLLTDMFDQSEIPEEQETIEDLPPPLDHVNYFSEPRPQRQHEFLGFRSLEIFLKYSRPIVVTSFLLILFARGCEIAGERHVQRQKSMFELSQVSFETRYGKKIAGLESKIFQLQAKTHLTAVEADNLQRFRIERNEIENRRAIELAKLENDSWNEMRFANNTTEANFAFWSYYRQLFVVLCTITLAGALFARFFSGKQIEKWLCAILLSIIAASVFLDRIVQLSAG